MLVLNLDLALYDDFENVVVFPGEFVPGREWVDEAGVAHRHDDALAGEAMPGGPGAAVVARRRGVRRLGRARA